MLIYFIANNFLIKYIFTYKNNLVRLEITRWTTSLFIFIFCKINVELKGLRYKYYVILIMLRNEVRFVIKYAYLIGYKIYKKNNDICGKCTAGS